LVGRDAGVYVAADLEIAIAPPDRTGHQLSYATASEIALFLAQGQSPLSDQLIKLLRPDSGADRSFYVVTVMY
jgi:hypothetical protein